jgi:hypothetical protein
MTLLKKIKETFNRHPLWSTLCLILTSERLVVEVTIQPCLRSMETCSHLGRTNMDRQVSRLIWDWTKGVLLWSLTVKFTRTRIRVKKSKSMKMPCTIKLHSCSSLWRTLHVIKTLLCALRKRMMSTCGARIFLNLKPLLMNPSYCVKLMIIPSLTLLITRDIQSWNKSLQFLVLVCF